MNSYIFLRNKKYRPSSYYRISQYIINRDINILEYEPNIFYKLKKYNNIIDKINNLFFQLIPGYTRRITGISKILLKNKDNEFNVYVQRSTFPKIIGPIGKILLNKMLSRAKEVYWDFDDNIIESGEVSRYERKILEKYSKKIIVGNEYLKSKLETKSQCKAILLPTTDKSMEDLDINEFMKKRIKSYKNKVELVWVGTSSNLQFLESIIPYLDNAAGKLSINHRKVLNLNIISNNSIIYDCKYLKINNIKWDRDKALKYMIEGHIGLMPLIEDYFTLGKCGFKAVQNIGVGLPTLASDIGFNKQVIVNGYNGFLVKDIEDWSKYIEELSINEELWRSMSIMARQTWDDKFNSRNVEKKIYELLDIKENEI